MWLRRSKTCLITGDKKHFETSFNAVLLLFVVAVVAVADVVVVVAGLLPLIPCRL